MDPSNPTAARCVVHFAHGKESGPWGSKITRLAEVARRRGLDVESLDYADLSDPAARAARLEAACVDDTRALVLVGSSMGGWVAARASASLRPLGLFLMAPAFFLPGYPAVAPGCAAEAIEVVHGWRDEVILYEHSVRFGRQTGCTLHLVDDDHRLQHCGDVLDAIFDRFLGRVAGASAVAAGEVRA